jgi:hypothetical protein
MHRRFFLKYFEPILFPGGDDVYLNFIKFSK